MKLVWVALPVMTLTACGLVDIHGADCVGREDARKYIAACARSRTDVYCKALLPTLQNISGEVTVVMVNLSDEERAAAIEHELRRQGLGMNGFVGSTAADRFARANIFLAPRIGSGQMTSLDGRSHTVTCAPNKFNTEICVIDGTVSGFNVNGSGPGIVGNIFTTERVLPFE